MFKAKKVILYNQLSGKDLIGNKFYTQQIMSKKGLPIPPFYCLTGLFYQEILVQIKNRIEPIISDINYENKESILEHAQKIEELFLSCELSEKNTGLIYEYFNLLFRNIEHVSVRASMIGDTEEESEDSTNNPFAGISTTYLYVKKEQLIESIKSCWASGFSPEALLYRKKSNLNLMNFTVAVGIQEMIFGNRSFVMFIL